MGRVSTCQKNCISIDLLRRSTSEARRRPGVGTPLVSFLPVGSFFHSDNVRCHYKDVIMSTMASQITSLTLVYSSVYSVADQRKHQRSMLLASVREIHWWPGNSPHKGPATRQMFPFDDVITWCNGVYLASCWNTFHLFHPSSSLRSNMSDQYHYMAPAVQPLGWYRYLQHRQGGSLKISQFASPRPMKVGSILLWLLCPPDPCNLPGTALLSRDQSSRGALKYTE